MSAATTAASLHRDALVSIFAWVSFKELHTLMQVCRNWHTNVSYMKGGSYKLSTYSLHGLRRVTLPLSRLIGTLCVDGRPSWYRLVPLLVLLPHLTFLDCSLDRDSATKEPAAFAATRRSNPMLTTLTRVNLKWWNDTSSQAVSKILAAVARLPACTQLSLSVSSYKNLRPEALAPLRNMPSHCHFSVAFQYGSKVSGVNIERQCARYIHDLGTYNQLHSITVGGLKRWVLLALLSSRGTLFLFPMTRPVQGMWKVASLLCAPLLLLAIWPLTATVAHWARICLWAVALPV